MKRFLINILKKLTGRKKLQKIYEAMFRIGLSGMNYGNGNNYREDGELNVLKIIKAKFSADIQLCIFDVGANVGNYSKALAAFFTDKAIIHSFEPSKKTFDLLAKNIAGISGITINNIGFSNADAELQLYSNKEASGLASVYQRNLEHFGITMNNSETITLTTIDNFCRQQQITQIHFLKLDIEGHELKALQGAQQMIAANKIDFIQFEFGGCNIDSRTYFQDFFYLLKDKFRLYRIVKDGLVEIADYKETNEIFMTINYLAVRRD